jgi:hypothetical protein
MPILAGRMKIVTRGAEIPFRIPLQEPRQTVFSSQGEVWIPMEYLSKRQGVNLNR